MSDAFDDVRAELQRARAKFPRAQASAHEGFAVLDEERDELWDEVKGNHAERKARMRAEAIQVAAMAIRFIEDVCDGAESPPPDAERAAEKALRELGKHDALYTHHGDVHARPEAYKILAKAFEAHARARGAGT